MADILIDDITNATNTGIFDKLMESVEKHVEGQYLNNRITSSDFAQVYLGSIQAVLQNAVQFALQEQLTEAQIDGVAADNLIKDKQLEIAGEELALKAAEANRLRDMTEAELEKQWGYDVTRDVDGELILGATTDSGRIDKEVEKMQADIDVSQEQVEIAKAQASKEYVDMLASLDKQLGYSYTLDANGDVVRSSITDVGGGKLDKEIEKMTADIDIAQQQVEIARTTNALEKAKALASIDKEFGFAVSEDPVDGSIIIGADTEDGRLDAEVRKSNTEVLLVEEQIRLAKTNTALEKAKAVASLDKEFGYDYTYDAEGNVVIGADQGDGKLDAEVTKMTADAEVALEQVQIAKTTNALERAKALASIDKEFGFEVSVDPVDGSLAVGNDTADGRLDAEVRKSNTEVLLVEEQIRLAKANTAIEKARAVASLDKEFGYNHTLDADGNVVLTTDAGDGKLDAEVTKLTADAEVALEQVKIAQTTSALEKARALASIDKEFGFEVLVDPVDGSLTVGQDTSDGKLDREIAKMDADIALTEQQVANAKTTKSVEVAQAVAAIAKEYGYSTTTDVNGIVAIDTDTGLGRLDKEISNLDKQGNVLATEEQLKQFQVDYTLPAELKTIEQKIVGKKQSAVIAE